MMMIWWWFRGCLMSWLIIKRMRLLLYDPPQAEQVWADNLVCGTWHTSQCTAIVKRRENVEVCEDDLDRGVTPETLLWFSPKPFWEAVPANHIHGPPHSANICYNFAFFIFTTYEKGGVKAFQNTDAVCPVCTWQFGRCCHWKFMERIIHPGLRHLCHVFILVHLQKSILTYYV